MHQHGWGSCRAKARFATVHEAEKRARKYGQRAYECDRCGGWHCSRQPYTPRPVRIRTEHPNVELDRARRGLAELRKKNITGPLRDAAEQRVRDLEAAMQGGRER